MQQATRHHNGKASTLDSRGLRDVGVGRGVGVVVEHFGEELHARGREGVKDHAHHYHVARQGWHQLLQGPENDLLMTKKMKQTGTRNHAKNGRRGAQARNKRVPGDE